MEPNPRKKKLKKRRKKPNPGARDDRRKHRRQDKMMHRKRDGKQCMFDDHHFGYIDTTAEDPTSVVKGNGFSNTVKVKVNESNVDRKNLSLGDVWTLATKKTEPEWAAIIHPSKTPAFENMNMHLWFEQFMGHLHKSADHHLFPVSVNEILMEMVPEFGFLGFKDESYDNPDPMIIAKETSDYDHLLRLGFEKIINAEIKGHLHSNRKVIYNEGYSLPGKKLFSYIQGPDGDYGMSMNYYEIFLGEDGFVYLRDDHEYDSGHRGYIERYYWIYKLKLSTFLDTFAAWKGCVPVGETLFPIEHGPTYGGENDENFFGWLKMIRSKWDPIVRIHTEMNFDVSTTAYLSGERM